MLSRRLAARSSHVARLASFPSQPPHGDVLAAASGPVCGSSFVELPACRLESYAQPSRDPWGGRRLEHSRSVLQRAAEKFLQDAEQPQVMEKFTEVEKTGRVNCKYGVMHQDTFAVVQLGSHQFKVTSDDLIYTERLDGVEVMDIVRLGRVLLLGTKEETTIGRPYIPGASVSAAVEEQCQDAKVIIFKRKRRKNYRRTQGHRQELTGLRILEVCFPSKAEALAKGMPDTAQEAAVA